MLSEKTTCWDPREHDPDVFIEKVVQMDVPDYAGRRLYTAIFQHGIHDPAVWGRSFQVPKRISERVGELPRLTLDGTQRSERDRFEKLRFRTLDGLAIETVLIPLEKEGAVSLCLSSQVGCAMACGFCATARMTSRRNLATWEIVDQWIQARQIVQSQGRRVTGTVFMGMGEPFLNYERVIAAAELFRCCYAGSLAARAMTISTVGLVPEIDRYTRENHRYRLSISLGAATDEARQRLVPVAARTPLVELMAAARRHALARRTRVNLSYVCIRGENIADSDARALADLIGDTPVRFDLIEVTDPTGRYETPSYEELNRFRNALKGYLRQPVVRRYSGGADIQAACGTLAAMDSPVVAIGGGSATGQGF